jgi:Acetyltransferase (GNAT) domain
MSLRVTLSGEPPVGWDASIVEKGGLLQSTYWGSLMVALGRGHPIYLQAFDGAKPVASLLAIHLKEKGGGTARRLAMALTLSGGRIEFGDGPVIHDAARAGEAVAALLDALMDHAGKNRIRLVRANGLSAASGLAGGADLAAAFAVRGFSASRWGTFLVDLTPDEEALLMSLDHAARKGVRKAAREGVRTERLTEWEDYREKFLLPYHSWTRPGEDAAAFLAEAKAIWDHPGHHDHYEYHAAIADECAVLAVLGMYCFADVATEITSGISPLAIERKLPAQDLLHWEMFRAARARGCRTFDLAGVSPDPQNGKEENIRRFKKKWGGAYTEFDRFEWRHWSLDLMARAGGRLAGAGGK